MPERNTMASHFETQNLIQLAFHVDVRFQNPTHMASHFEKIQGHLFA